MMSVFEQFAAERQRLAGAKYVDENGRNEALDRDCGLDVLEELADAWNITKLWVERYREVYGEIDFGFMREVTEIELGIKRTARLVENLRKSADLTTLENCHRLVYWSAIVRGSTLQRVINVREEDELCRGGCAGSCCVE